MEHAADHPGCIHLHPLRGGAFNWLHMSVAETDTAHFLMEDAKLNDNIVDALLEEDTRSRIRITDQGIMVLLKASASQDPSKLSPVEMITMRIWIEADRVISTHEKDTDPILQLYRELNKGGGPQTPTEFLIDLIDRHLASLNMIVEEVEDNVRDIDDLLANANLDEVCSSLSTLQRRISTLIRHLAPQRAVFGQLVSTNHPLIDEDARAKFDGHLNHLLRLLETLTGIRERSDIIHSQHERILDRDQSKTAHLFAVVATVFLPLGFITGMWGVNVSGIPLAEIPNGFAFLMLGCFGLMLLLVILFKFRRWL